MLQYVGSFQNFFSFTPKIYVFFNFSMLKLQSTSTTYTYSKKAKKRYCFRTAHTIYMRNRHFGKIVRNLFIMYLHKNVIYM